MQFALLPHRGLIRLSGEDNLSFLQGLVSNDVTRLPKAGIVYAALLSPQGKFLHDFFLMEDDGSVLLDCEKDRLPDLLKRLNMYRLRSKVTLEVLPDSIGVVALWKGTAKPAVKFKIFSDPRLQELGYRAVGDTAAIISEYHHEGMMLSDANAYDRMRLELGVPDGSRDLVVDKSTLLPFGFEQLHGVDFSKGCYVGQEVTARMKHIGQARKCVHKVTAISGALPAPGTAITLGETPAGTLCSHAGDIGLALMSLDVMAKAQDPHFHCGNATVHIKLPAWNNTK